MNSHLTLALLASLLLPNLCPRFVAADEAPQQIYSLDDRKLVKVLLATMRRTSTTAEQRDKIVDKIFEVGPGAVKELHRDLLRDLNRKTSDYENVFSRRATQLYQTRYRAINGNEVIALRQTVLALKERKELTKEMIVKEGDPAMDKLMELLVLPMEEVLKDEKLSQQRADLLTMGAYLTRAKALLAEQEASDDKPVEPTADFATYLDNSETQSLLLAMPTSAGNRSVLAGNQRLVPQIDPEEAACIHACNLMRVILGLNALAIDTNLCAAARDHSKDMDKLKFFAHESPVPGKTKFTDRAARFRTTASGENIFAGSTKGEQANNAWFHSPGHHRNMLNNHRRIGVGKHERHFTELFGR